jgi:hypothetical protein
MIGGMPALFRHRSVRSRRALVTLLAAAVVTPVLAGCSEARTGSAAPAGTSVGPATEAPVAAASPSTAWTGTLKKVTAEAAKAAIRATKTSRVRAATPRAARPGSALAVLATLRVRGRGPMTGYSRDRFGPAWLDVDRNGCDTRNDILRAQLTRIRLKPGTSGCVVASGRLLDPYTGTSLPFRRGPGDAIQIDHVVALGNAWVSGAARWPIARRAALAEDPENLLAVDARTNEQKGDGDAATWLPPFRRGRCGYVARQVGVKAKYGLSVTRAERAAIARVLTSCPDQPLPRPSGQPTTTDLHVIDPGPPGAPPPSVPPAPAAGGGGTVAYANCAAVRAAGKAPLLRGQPGYASHLDGDDDGIACE